MLDPQARKDIILADAKELAFAQGFELVEDQVLLDEVAGLVEWPVALMGSFDEEFLSIPDEVIRATIRNNQKCFVVSDPKTGKLTNKFILTANIEATDGGKTIIAGNERVIRARLSRRKILLRDRPEDEARSAAAEVRADRVSREARHAGRADQADRAAGGRDRAAGRRRCRKGQARRASGESRSAHRSRRRIPRIAGPDGQVLRAGAGRRRLRRRRERGALQAARARRSRADRSGERRGRAGRQDRHAGRLLGDRREADGKQGSLCAAARGAGCDQADRRECACGCRS